MIENTTPLGSIKCFEATIFDDDDDDGLSVVVFPERRRRRRRRRSNKPKKLFEGGVENFSSSRVGRERELFKKLGGLGYSSFLCTVR